MKPLPELKTNEEAEDFITNSDLTEYDLSFMKTLHFEFQPKSERVNMRLPRPLLNAVKATAAEAGVPLSAIHSTGIGDGCGVA